MPLPGNLLNAVVGAIGGAAKTNPLGGAVLGFASGLQGPSPVAGQAGSTRRRRRSKRILTTAQKADLSWIAQNLGKTAAANYMSRL